MRAYVRAVLIAFAALQLVRLDRYLATLALLAYLAFSVPHTVFHLAHLEHGEPGWSVVLAIGVSLMVVLPLTALAGTRRMT
jgi:hypothetical protein